MSEALLDIVKPDVRWPPAPGDLQYLRASVEIAGAVWNASLSRDPDERDAALARLGEAHARTLGAPVQEVLDFIRPISARKLELHPNDLRYVVDVNVRLDGDRIVVDAASAYRRS